jgi:hypothetical protein
MRTFRHNGKTAMELRGDLSISLDRFINPVGKFLTERAVPSL